jgi:hypothetical protein
MGWQNPQAVAFGHGARVPTRATAIRPTRRVLSMAILAGGFPLKLSSLRVSCKVASVTDQGASQADRDLAARLGVSARQVRRWREEGWLKPEKRGLGRGLGSSAFYSEEAVNQAASLAEALGKYERLDEAGLVLFLRGFSVRETSLKKAYANCFARTRRFLKISPDQDPWDMAYRASRLFSRRSSTSMTAREWRARLRAKKKGHQLAPVLHDLIRFLFIGAAEEGETLTPEVFEAMGIDDFFYSLPADDQDKFHGLIRQLSLPSLERVVEESDLAELEKGRDNLRAVLELFPGLALDEFTMAIVGIPGTLVTGSVLGAAFAAGLAQLGEPGEE